MKPIKKLACTAIIMSVFGFSLFVNAEAHTHISRMMFAGTVSSVTTTHQYVTAVNHDKYGNIVGYQYGTCYVTQYFDSYNYVCQDCGAITGQAPQQVRVVHSVNH